MKKLTFAEECIDRAQSLNDLNHGLFYSDNIISKCEDWRIKETIELATRLKRACNMLRSEAICKDHYLGNTDHIHRLIEELEEPLGEK